MLKRIAVAAAAFLLMPSVPALAEAGDFTLVNGVGADMSGVSIRRTGTTEWTTLSVSPKAGGRGTVKFHDPDCAFDIRATLAGGGTAVWSGVNLCEAKAVTLNRNESGAAWVDYD
jgi:hypothetical protein